MGKIRNYELCIVEADCPCPLHCSTKVLFPMRLLSNHSKSCREFYPDSSRKTSGPREKIIIAFIDEMQFCFSRQYFPEPENFCFASHDYSEAKELDKRDECRKKPLRMSDSASIEIESSHHLC